MIEVKETIASNLSFCPIIISYSLGLFPMFPDRRTRGVYTPGLSLCKILDKGWQFLITLFAKNLQALLINSF